MKTAKVIEAINGKDPQTLLDDDGITWEYVVDDACGTIAVQTDASYPPRAGIARWRSDGTLEIFAVDDGKTYGVNCTEEYTARDGEWVLTDPD